MKTWLKNKIDTIKSYFTKPIVKKEPVKKEPTKRKRKAKTKG